MSSSNTDRGYIMRRVHDAIDLSESGSYWFAAAILVIAVIVRSYIWLNADVSWLLTLGEQVLAGARAYTDFSEPNPPASILIYMPATLLGQLFGASAESMLAVLAFAATFASLWMVGRILPGDALAASREKPVLFALACALLLILPGDNFAERENIAVIAILPMLAVYAARASGLRIDFALAALAGIGGGIAVAIKPYFALALIVPLPFVVLRARALGQKLTTLVFSPEHITAALAVLFYFALLFWRFSDYLDRTLPLVLTLYVPLRYSLLFMLENPSVFVVLMVAMVGLGLGAREFRSPVIAVSGLAAIGFTAALIVQGKGWPYHGYPAVALSMLALCVLLVRRLTKFRDRQEGTRSPAIELAFGATLSVCIYGVASLWLLQEPDRSELVGEVSRLAPAHPKIYSIDGAPGLAFPLTRKLQGAPLGRTPFQWITTYTDKLLNAGDLDPASRKKMSDPAARRKIEEYAREDRFELAATIRTRHPDVILIEGKANEKWAFSYPEIAAVLAPYRKAETFNHVEIWILRDPASATSP